MQGKVSRRTLAQVAPASLLTLGNPTTSFAQTPVASEDEDRYPDLIDRLAATDPQTTLDLLLETPFDEPWLVPLGSIPPLFQPETYDTSEDETFGTGMIGTVHLIRPEAETQLGLFLIFPDAALAAEAVEMALASENATAEPLTLAGLDAVMALYGERRANVMVQADYVVIVSTDEILSDGALTNSFAAQIRALQNALGLTWHLFRTLPR